MSESLYERLGGYEAIAALTNEMLPRLIGDEVLGRFWLNRSDDSKRREHQLLIDYLCVHSGGPLHYVGRDLITTHRGMGITDDDWTRFMGHLIATLEKLELAERERTDLLSFVASLESAIVDP